MRIHGGETRVWIDKNKDEDGKIRRLLKRSYTHWFVLDPRFGPTLPPFFRTTFYQYRVISYPEDGG
jgi:hypothetical protein